MLEYSSAACEILFLANQNAWVSWNPLDCDLFIIQLTLRILSLVDDAFDPFSFSIFTIFKSLYCRLVKK